MKKKIDSKGKTVELVAGIGGMTGIDYIRFIVDFIDDYVEKGSKLTSREKDFVVATVEMFSNGKDISNKDSVESYIKDYGFSSKSHVYAMRSSLAKKRWLKKDKRKVLLPEFLDMNGYADGPTKFSYVITPS